MSDGDDQRLAEDIARGLAHNINNILASVIGNLSVARASLPPGDPISSRLDAAEQASFRLQEITERLQLYARRVDPVLAEVSVAAMVSDALSQSGVRAAVDVGEGLFVHGDAGLLARVLRELLLNAADAGGVAVRVHVILDGDAVEIVVSDAGPGIAPEIKARMFEPFATTRARGRGLGLSIVASLMRVHHGSVRHEVRAGRTAFVLRLPGALREVVEEEVGPLRVLVMDDEAALRDILGEMIRLMGHEVSIASSGEEALERFEEALTIGRPFGLVVLDLMVPGGASGAEILHRMRRLSPGLRAVVSSGYWAEATTHLGPGGFQASLIKPFTLGDVNAAVEAALRD